MSSADRVSECSSQVGSDDGKNGDLTISRTKTASSEASDRKEYDGEGPAYRYPTQDRSELRRLASVWSGVPSRHATTEELQRQETVTGILPSDPRLNPNDPAFDFHLWARVLSRTLEREGVRRPRAGFTFKNLNVSGIGAGLQLQKSVGSVLMTPFGFKSIWRQRHASEKLILKDFHGAVRSGEMLIVLGRPGSGCTTFLKSVCGQLHGLKKSPASVIHYNGIPQDLYVKEFRGEIVYNEENEKHFPHLTVGQTLRFAAAARTPSNRVHDIPRLEFSKYATQIAMNLFGLSHVENTKVGDDFIRGVSGGERKRVSIAEMAVSGAPIAAWDNATRGLDAATALDFVRASKVSSQIWGTTHAVAIYQASQSIYDVFDKAMVLYEGREIYFGPAQKARAYFENMGWSCPQRQTTGDFLTSVTNPHERQARPGFEERVPRTPDEFENYWHQSAEYKVCLDDIQRVEAEYPIGGSTLDEFRTSHRRTQAKHTRPTSPYRISIPMQVRLCVTRAYQRMWNDKASVLTRIIGQTIQALIIGSIYYGTPSSTSGFFSTGALLFFAILLNALMSVSEINTLYKQRPIVEKHKSFALYHPFTEALAGFIADVPVKLVGSTMFNLVLYFLGGLRYEPGPFFIFFLFTFVAMLTMSTIFRTIAASTKAVTQAMGIAGVMILAIVIYTGFTLQKSYMHPWFKWINYINPVGYAYEALLVNEIHGRYFPCSPTSLVPPYGTGENFRCAVAGSVPGELDVSGDAWMNSSYGYRYSHLWRNLGFMFAFMIFFFVLYLLISELNSTPTSTAEFLVYRRGHVPKHLQHPIDDIEASGTSCSKNKEITPDEGSGRDVKPLASLPPQKDIFTWQDVTLDIPVKDGQRRLLDHVSGWVKPGTLTALMGVSGAGKTTLLDALAQRIKIGVLTGDMLVNGRPLDASFQRKTGYVQQQDLHLETATVREALRFSAMLRQPQSVPVKEKYESVEEVIKMLNMEDFSEAIIGVPGEGDDPPAKAGYILIDLGLNIEQRKLLTIGVELAARPALLLFLDEPTSGLDSQSSWTIITLLRRLADSGQAVLSTIHQPSAMLFQQFDRLLFLAKGGKTVYFGDIGANSRTLLDYFETAGARRCDDKENPAEYMLEIVGVGSHHKTEIDWAEVWNTSQQSRGVQAELDRISALSAAAGDTAPEVVSTSKFALPLALQTYHVTKRVFQQYWRTPQYVMGKFMLCTMSALFVGFSFYKQNSSQTGMQNTIFAIFMVTTIFTPLVQQIMPRFISQRALYEARERPSMSYSWVAFIFSNIVVEIPYQIVAAVLVYVSWYFPVFNTHQPASNQGLMLAFCIEFYMYTSTFAYMVIAALPNAETGAMVATLLFSLILTFNGVLQTPSSLPGFWIFMWRVSPFTYMVGGWAGTGLANRPVHCAQNELAIFDPPAGQTCKEYLTAYFEQGAIGQLYNPEATAGCEYCPLSNANQFLALSSIYPSQRYRNLGIGFAYIAFNVIAAVTFYYAFRVRRTSLATFVQGRVKALRSSKQPTEKPPTPPGPIQDIAESRSALEHLEKVDKPPTPQAAESRSAPEHLEKVDKPQ